MQRFVIFLLDVLDRYLKNKHQIPVSPPPPPVPPGELPPTPPPSPAPSPPVASPPQPPAPGIPNQDKAWFQNLLNEHNSERLVSGLAVLGVNAKLCQAAQAHADWMAANKKMSHTGDGGSTVSTRVSKAGYVWATVGENIAWGQGSSSEVFTAWMNSNGHRANILNSRYREIGIGLTNSPNGPYWAVVFGTPRTLLTKFFKHTSTTPGGVVSEVSKSGVTK